MGQAFDRCYKNGGEIKTLQVGKNSYRHVCYIKGKEYLGVVKKKKSKNKK